MKVLYASSEALPFVASGGLADVAGSLPQALRRRRVGCRVVLPLYGTIPQELRDTMQFITSITVPVAWRRQYCGIFEARHGGVVYYLLDNEYYFKRGSIYGHYDDGERFAFFARAVLEMLPHIGWKPDVIHCNDWQTALTPVYFQTMYANREGYENIKTVFTIHNIQYQGRYSLDILEDVFGLSRDDAYLVEYNGDINLMKGAIECAHQVTTVSPTYAEEILDPWFSYGLDPILRERSFKLRGILNGIDVQLYDPENDPMILSPYSSQKPEGKAVNKAHLQSLLHLEQDPNAPLVGMVTRLVAQKGLDLVRAMLDELMQMTDVQIAVLGSGDKEYEEFFRYIESKYPGRAGVRIGFIPDMAHKIYAGSDIFLMPSKTEPCGLSQMVALRYGAIPIVRETGGLHDSVQDSGDGEGNGFTFRSYNAHDMNHAIHRALMGFRDAEGWQTLTCRAMECDNSWTRSAGEYIRMYKSL